MGLGIFKRFYKKKSYQTKKRTQVSRPPPPRYVSGGTGVADFEREKTQGFDIPSEIPDDFPPAKSRGFMGGSKKGKGQRQVVSLTYPLIPKKPKVGEFVYAYAKIYFDHELKKYIYQVFEPPLTPNIKTLIHKVKELLEQKLDVDFSKLKSSQAKDYLATNIAEILRYFGFKVSDTEKKILQYYIIRDFIGLGKVEPFMSDEQIEDVSCDGVGIPIYVYHRDSNVASVVTNVVFETGEELDNFITRLAQMSGKAVSIASPLVSGSLPDGSRLQATLATDIARRGSNFTIRKFTEIPLTPTDLMKFGTVDEKILAYLWLMVDYNKSILVSGGTATGKTTFLNVLSLFIRPERKIVSIEDTPELKLPHPHWVPQVARTATASQEGVRTYGEVDMFDLLKESLRQRPDNIIVGEVRGKEAFVLFQEMATGHPSLATIHAENMTKLIDRLTTPPIGLPATLLESLDLVIFLLLVKYQTKQVRRVAEIEEIVGVHPQDKTLITNKVFRWNAAKDEFEVIGKSTIMKKISNMTGITEDHLQEELQRRMGVLMYMKKKNITDYKEVYNVINTYYYYPEKIMASVSREI